MADLRIVDAPLLSTVKGTEKIPTGGEGNFSVSVNQVADFAKLKWFLATEGYVDIAVGNVQADLNLHKNSVSNPHQVTKTQVGLGNVDNTADLDKPVSNATKSAITTANSGKADKSYVDSQDQLKADKVDLTASKISSDGGQTQQSINDFGGAKWYNKSGGYELGATVKLANGDTVQSTKSANTANPNVDMTGWVLINDSAQLIFKASALNSTIRSVLDKLEDTLSVKDFGAKGDGVTDDTIAIQNTFVYAYYNKRSVIFPTGDYLISKPILVFVANLEHLSSINISGESMARTRIICSSSFSAHLSSGSLAETAAFIVVNETFLNSDGTFKNGTGWTHGVYISNMTLLCQSNSAKYGIMLPILNAASTYKRLHIEGFSNAGIKNFYNFYLNIFEKVRVQNSPIGFDQELGIKTSIKYDSCYVVGANDKAYHVGGNYMNMTNCCADGCTGTVFHLRGFMGAIINAGSESPKAKKMFYAGQYTEVSIINPNVFGVWNDPEYICIDARAGSSVTIQGGSLAYDTRPVEDRVKPMKGALVQRGTQSYVSFENTNLPRCDINNSYEDHTIYSKTEQKTGGAFSRYGNRLAFLGFDGAYPASRYIDHNQTNPSLLGNAIFFGLGDTTNQNMKGADTGFGPPVNMGDVLLSQVPKKIGGLGWVALNDSSKDLAFLGTVTSIDGDVLTFSEVPYLESYANDFQIPPSGRTVKSSSGGTGTYSTFNAANSTITLGSKSGSWGVGDKVYMSKITELRQCRFAKVPTIESGTTALRTPSVVSGQMYYDTTVQKPIWWSGSRWVGSKGTSSENVGINISVTTSSTSLNVTLPVAESSSSYGVSIALNWNATFWITKKTTSGFTVNFSNAPSVASMLDWQIFK